MQKVEGRLKNQAFAGQAAIGKSLRGKRQRPQKRLNKLQPLRFHCPAVIVPQVKAANWRSNAGKSSSVSLKLWRKDHRTWKESCNCFLKALDSEKERPQIAFDLEDTIANIIAIAAPARVMY